VVLSLVNFTCGEESIVIGLPVTDQVHPEVHEGQVTLWNRGLPEAFST